MSTKQIGVCAILVASLMWAIEPIFVKFAYKNADFIQTSAIRAICITLIAFIYVLITNKKSFAIKKKHLPSLIYLGAIGTLADLLYYFSLTKIPVLNAVLIGHMQPIFIILIGFFVLRDDSLTKHDYIGISIMIVAAFLVTTKTPYNLVTLRLGSTGDIFVLFATIAWASTAIVMRKYLKDLHAGILSFYRYMIASIIFITYLSLSSSLKVSNYYQIFVGVIVGIGVILYYEGLKRIKAAQVGALELATPFFTAILGFLILKELVSTMQFIGIISLVVGIYFLSIKEETYF